MEAGSELARQDDVKANVHAKIIAFIRLTVLDSKRNIQRGLVLQKNRESLEEKMDKYRCAYVG